MDLNYYAVPGAFTRLDRHPDFVAALPADPARLRAVVAGLIRHVDWGWAYETAVRDPAPGEINLRSAGEMVDVILGRAGPIDRERPPDDRMVGCCRHYAVLHTALLRAHRIPARVRAGFATYFGGDPTWDHWVTEYHDGSRWVRCDPQLDPTQLRHVTVDPDDLPATAFLTAGEAWSAYRAGALDVSRFGVEHACGPGFVAGSVVQDLGCLNKVEMLPWDTWGAMLDWDDDGAGRDGDGRVDRDLVDRLAGLDQDHTDSVRAAWERTPGVRVPEDLAGVRCERG